MYISGKQIRVTGSGFRSPVSVPNLQAMIITGINQTVKKA
jgi:hypothetical protein